MKKTLNSEMIVLAREFRNLTQEQLARKLFVSQATVAKIEGDLYGELQEQLIDRIAKALEFPSQFFFQNEERLGFGSSAFFYRKREKITASDRKRISSTVNLVRINLKRLLSMVDLQSNKTLPFYEIESFGGKASNVAAAVRSFWGLPDGPIRNITALIESAGILVVPCDFGTRFFDGTSLNLNDMPPLIFINKDLPGDRWRFTLAHELAHLVMHDVPRESMENEADEFAAEFLMPGDELRAQFSRMRKIRLQELSNLKPYWKVSIASLIMRASTLGFLTKNQARYLWMQMSKAGYKLKEPNEFPRESVANYANLFGYFKETLGFGVDELAKLTLVHRQAFESLHQWSCALGPTRHLRIVQ